MEKVEDLKVRNATPIICNNHINNPLSIDMLHFSVSEKCYDVGGITKRILIYHFENGGIVDVATLTKSKQEGHRATAMISYKDSLIQKELKEFMSNKNMLDVYDELVESRKLVKLAEGDFRLLAIVLVDGKKKYTCIDRRKDLENLVAKNNSISYKIVYEKFGYSFSKKTEKEYLKKYPKANIEAIKEITQDDTIDCRDAYKEIAKLLTKKKHTKNFVKVDAKRLLSRVKGDRIWDKQ